MPDIVKIELWAKSPAFGTAAYRTEEEPKRFVHCLRDNLGRDDIVLLMILEDGTEVAISTDKASWQVATKAEGEATVVQQLQDEPVEGPPMPDWAPSDGPWCLKQWIRLRVPAAVSVCLLPPSHDGKCRDIHGLYHDQDSSRFAGILPLRE